MSYAEFLETKGLHASDDGLSIDPSELNPALYPFQRSLVSWACRKGRAAIFADCGLGKTLMQLEWADRMRGIGRALIVAPLAVTHQTEREAERFGITGVRYAPEPGTASIEVTNYERLDRFDPDKYRALVLDESSILKSIAGKTRRKILDAWVRVPYRLACTATPAPNDVSELGNHSEFLGLLSFKEMSATFFVKESNSAHWRLKGHATDAFYRWLASWAMFLRRPSDIGFEDEGFDLPPLTINDEIVETSYRAEGKLFTGLDDGIQGRLRARRATLDARVERTASLLTGDDQWIVWCGLNEEGRKLHAALNGQSVLVEGSQSEDEKWAGARRWLDGDARVMISKPSIFGFGMNFQHCSRMAFLGLGDSYEQYYQAIRRCWRFGQERPVDVRIVVSDAEQDIVTNVRRKEADNESTRAGVIESVASHEIAELDGKAGTVEYKTEDSTGKGWRLMMGDSAERLKEIDPETVGLSVFSPPFVSLYTYTATERDLGNSRNTDEFFEHFRFIIDGLLRATMPGRLCAVHVAQVPAMLVRDGYIGMKDFRADTVKAFQERGWIYHGEVVIDKDPQAQAIRTKAKGLLFVQLKKDSAWLRPALADYILVFRKPGDNPKRIIPDVSNEEWIQWARPVWYGIQESNTLNFREARTDKDERHICPLQLDVIERCVRLWSAPDDLVCSPFAGIGSEGYVAVRNGRLFVGCELKPEYYKIAKQNLEAAEKQSGRLF